MIPKPELKTSGGTAAAHGCALKRQNDDKKNTQIHNAVE